MRGRRGGTKERRKGKEEEEEKMREERKKRRGKEGKRRVQFCQSAAFITRSQNIFLFYLTVAHKGNAYTVRQHCRQSDPVPA